MSSIQASSQAVGAFNRAYQRAQQSIVQAARRADPQQAAAGDAGGSALREQVLQQAAIEAMKIAQSQSERALDLLA